MRICFCSDAHGNKYAVKQFLNDVEKQQVDKIIYGGDFFGYYYYPEEIITEFRNRNIECIMGNHDRMFLDILEGKSDDLALSAKYGNTYLEIQDRISKENVEFLYSLKKTYTLEIDSLKMLFVHGSVDDPLNGRVYPDTEIINEQLYIPWDYIFMGHTHHKMERQVGSCHIVNPGSIGQARDGKGNSYLIFDTQKQKVEWRIFSYDYEMLLKDIEKNEQGNLLMINRLQELATRDVSKRRN